MPNWYLTTTEFRGLHPEDATVLAALPWTEVATELDRAEGEEGRNELEWAGRTWGPFDVRHTGLLSGFDVARGVFVLYHAHRWCIEEGWHATLARGLTQPEGVVLETWGYDRDDFLMNMRHLKTTIRGAEPEDWQTEEVHIADPDPNNAIRAAVEQIVEESGRPVTEEEFKQVVCTQLEKAGAGWWYAKCWNPERPTADVASMTFMGSWA